MSGPFKKITDFRRLEVKSLLMVTGLGAFLIGRLSIRKSVIGER